MSGAIAFGHTMNLHQSRLLIVEDNLALQQMLCWEFEELGYAVTAVDCCSRARQAVEESHFDLALIDCNLPDGCGSKLMSQLHSADPNLPVILSSGRMTEQTLQAGAYCFIPKPVSAKALHLIFQKALTDKDY